MSHREERPTRVRWWVLVLACATSALLYLHRYSWGLIKADVKREFGLTDRELGWLDSAFDATYALFQIPMGYLGDVAGPALVLPLLAIAWSGALSATGMASGFWTLASTRLGFGMAQAGAYPNLSKVTRNWFALSTRTTVQGLVASFSGRAGGACASLIVGTVLMGSLGLGWRATLLSIAAVGVLLAGALRFVLRDRIDDHPWANAAEIRLLEPTGESSEGVGVVRYSRDPAALASFAALLGHMLFSAFANALYVYWIPLFLEEDKGFTKVAMGIFSSLPLWASAFGGLCGGALNDILARRWGRRFARRVVGLFGKLLGAALIVVSLQATDGRSAMVVVAAAKFFSDFSQPTVWGTVTDIAGGASGRVFGLVNTAGSLGAFLAGPVLGAIKQDYGWSALFWTVGLAYVLSALAWLVIDPTRRIVVDAPQE